MIHAPVATIACAARIVAAVIRNPIAVIACFAPLPAKNAIAASGAPTSVQAIVVVVAVGIVTGFSKPMNVTVTAARQRAIVQTTVGRARIVIVAGFIAFFIFP